MRKMTMLVSGGIGYVLGSRAGRERYEQIRGMAMKVKGNPTVQAKAQQAADLAKEAAPVVKEKVADAAGAAKDKMSGGTDTGSDVDEVGPNGVPLTDSAYPRNDDDARQP
jgi:hypothetical protein